MSRLECRGVGQDVRQNWERYKVGRGWVGGWWMDGRVELDLHKEGRVYGAR